MISDDRTIQETRCSLPPGPTLDTAAWLAAERSQLRSLQEFSSCYGPIFTVYGEGIPPRVYVADPDAIRDIFVLHAAHLDAQGTSLFKPLVGVDAVVFLNGRRHREARQLLGHALHSEDLQERLDMMANVVSAEAYRIPANVRIPLQDFTNDVTRRVIVTLLFGQMPQSWSRTLLDGLGTAIACLHDRQAAMLAPSDHGAHNSSRGSDSAFHRARANLDRILHRRLVLHRSSRDIRQAAVLDHLIDASTSAGRLSDREIVGYLKTLLVSGHETTSASLAWTLCHLASRPDVRARLRRELDASGGSRYLALPYLRAVCQETLRCSSPVPNGAARKVVNEFSAQGYTFRPGVEIVPCICVVHQREDIFTDATVFDPQRFVGRSYRGDEYLPFGVGSRHCPGASLALQELTVALAVIVARPDIHIEVPDDALGGMSIGPTVRVPHSATLRRTAAVVSKR